MAAAADPQLQQLLKEQAAYFTLTEAGKVRCLCNGHEFPARYDVLASFIKCGAVRAWAAVAAAASQMAFTAAHSHTLHCRGSKFATARKRYDAEQSLTKYEPFIVQSKNFP
jgi:hypothetical protein